MDLVRSRSSNSLEASTTYLRNCGNRHDPRPRYGDRQPVRTPRRTMDEKDVSPEKMVAMQPDQVHLTIWAKGKVERMVYYVRDAFLNGRTFTDLADLNAQARSWLTHTANTRIHATTGQRPLDLWPQEKLTALTSVARY